MSIISKAEKYLEQDTAKLCRTSVYGLHYTVNICNILNRHMIIQVLKNNSASLTADEIKMLESKISMPTKCLACNK